MKSTIVASFSVAETALKRAKVATPKPSRRPRLIRTDAPSPNHWPLETLKEISPETVRVAVLYSPKTFAMKLTDTSAQDAAEMESAIDGFAQSNSGLLVLPDATTLSHRI
jgi:hypothetical protein